MASKPKKPAKKTPSKPKAPKVSTANIETFMLCSEDLKTSIFGRAAELKKDGIEISPANILEIGMKYFASYAESTGQDIKSVIAKTKPLIGKSYNVPSAQMIADAKKLIADTKLRKQKVTQELKSAGAKRKKKKVTGKK